MKRWMRFVAVGAIGMAGTAAMVVLYRSHQGEDAAESERDAPVVAPSRVVADTTGPVVALDSADIARIASRPPSCRAPGPPVGSVWPERW